MTGFENDERSKAKRRMENIDVEERIQSLRKEIMKCSKVSFEPIIFKIDSLPMGEEEIEASKNSRDAIISYIFSLRDVSILDLKIFKTRAILNADLEKKRYYEGKINGYNERLTQANQNAEQALKDTIEKEDIITENVASFIQLKEELENKDSDEEMLIHKWSVDSAWKVSKLHQKQPFNIDLPMEFTRAEQWSNGHCTWHDWRVNHADNTVSGSVKGDFGHGLYASITVFTTRRMKYQKEIKGLREAVELKEVALENAKEDAEVNRQQHHLYEKEVNLMHNYIEEARKKIIPLARNFLSIAEARERYEE